MQDLCFDESKNSTLKFWHFLTFSRILPESGLRLVVWNGEHYFLTLANLWANLISCDSPKLPRISGS